MDWFLYDNSLRHERDKEIRLVLAQVLSASNANSFRVFKQLNYTSLYA